MTAAPLPPPARVLPPAAARLLQQAAETPNTRENPWARIRAIEKATARVKRDYPQFFKE